MAGLRPRPLYHGERGSEYIEWEAGWGVEWGSTVWKIEKSLFLAVNCLTIPRLSVHNLIPRTKQQL